MSERAFSANSRVISSFESEALAMSLISAPSSSLIFENIFFD